MGLDLDAWILNPKPLNVGFKSKGFRFKCRLRFRCA